MKAGAHRAEKRWHSAQQSAIIFAFDQTKVPKIYASNEVDVCVCVCGYTVCVCRHSVCSVLLA